MLKKWLAMIAAAAMSAALILGGCGGGKAAGHREGAAVTDYESLLSGDRIRAPEFPAGREWLNTGRPLTLRELRGKFVLLDFWTYCCINCIHLMPDLAYLEHKYASEPFVVIGVHSAKFTNERDSANIRQAIMRYEISHPVVNDARMEVWRAYGVPSWPTQALIDPEGYVVWSALGEGHRETLDRIIGAGLQRFDGLGKLDRAPLDLRHETRPESDLAYPGKLAADPAANRLYISDSNHNRIVVADLDGGFIEVIGSGVVGLQDGSYTEARFNRPQGLALYQGDLIVADAENHALRRVDTKSRIVRTIAGTGEQSRTYARGSGRGRDVALSTPWDVVVREHAVYIAMAGTHQIRRYDLARDYVEPFAGTGREARTDGPARRATFAQPSGLATDGGKLYVADSEISSVRAIDLASAQVQTIAGGDLFDFGDIDGRGDQVRLQHPLGVIFHQGKLYLADTYNHKIKVVYPDTGRVVTYLGGGKPGLRDGKAAEFYEPSGFAAAGDRLYVADTNNHRIRVINLLTDEVSTLALKGVPLPESRPVSAVEPREPVELAPVILAPGKGELRLVLSLAPGHHLTAGAPSAYSAAVDGASIKFASPQGAIESQTVVIPYEAVSGEGALSLETTVYHCSDAGLCQVRAMAWRVTVKIEQGGTRRIELRDDLAHSAAANQ